MAPEDKRPIRGDNDQDAEDLSTRFPDLPATPDVPEVPGWDSVPESVKEVTNLPAHDVPEVPRLAPVVRPAKPQTFSSRIEAGSYRKAAIASTAATSFIMPTLVLALLGYWLDIKLHHATNYLAFVGVVLGLVVGVTALMRIIKRLED